MTRNKLLYDIAVKIGVQDPSSSPRNQILDDIAIGYGANVPNKTMIDLLHGIDSVLHIQHMPKDSSNGHLKSIAELLGSTTLPDGMSRNYYLGKWLEYAQSVVKTWILASGSWADDGYWDDSSNWNDGV